MNVSKMNRACINGKCVSYFRHSETTVLMKTCNFVFDAGALSAISIFIKSNTDSGVNSANAHLGFISRIKEAETVVPFSALDKESAASDNPICHYRFDRGHTVVENGCPSH